MERFHITVEKITNGFLVKYYADSAEDLDWSGETCLYFSNLDEAIDQTVVAIRSNI